MLAGGAISQCAGGSTLYFSQAYLSGVCVMYWTAIEMGAGSSSEGVFNRTVST